MALRWVEGFDVRQSTDYFTRLYGAYAGISSSAQFQTGRRHGLSWEAANSQLTTPVLVPAVENVWIIHFAIRMSSATQSLASSTPGFTISDGTGSQLELRLIASSAPDEGGFMMRLLRGATTLATSPVYARGSTPQAWHVFQLKVTIHPSTGTYELLHYDYQGTETTAIAAATGANTANQGTAGGDRVTIKTGNQSAAEVTLDDIVILDGTGGALDDFFAKPVCVLGELPNGDGDTTDFEPSTAGTNVEMVNDTSISAGESTEVTSPDVGSVDLYQFSQAQLALLPTTVPPTIYGIMVDIEALMKNSGTANLRVEVKDGMDQATDTKDMPFTGSAKASHFSILVENPTGTPAPWTPADLTSIQLGFRYNS